MNHRIYDAFYLNFYIFKESFDVQTLLSEAIIFGRLSFVC